MDSWCWIGHNRLSLCRNWRRNKDCMLKSRHRRFTLVVRRHWWRSACCRLKSRHWRSASSRAEYFSKANRCTPGSTFKSGLLWDTERRYPVENSRRACFSLSTDWRRRRRWLILCSFQCSYQFSQFIHLSLCSCHFVHLSLHGCYLFLEQLILFLEKICHLFYICPSAVYASWSVDLTSGHFFSEKRVCVRLRIWNYECSMMHDMFIQK